MSFLERAIRKGVSDAVGKAVGGAIRQAVEPAATNLVNQATKSLDRATQTTQSTVSAHTSGLESAMANLERSMQGYATEAAKNMKVCPECGKPNGADKNFCAECGGKLPEQTLAQSSVCTSCGKQNSLGTKFCQDCGAKLPITIQEEEQLAQKNASVLASWDEKLPHYPKWNCGGSDFYLEELDIGYFCFSANFKGDHIAAKRSVEEYRQLLLQNGFKQAGQYPSMEHLYKMVNDVCYHVDTEHCFEGDADCPNISFDKSEPTGGFYYVKPEPKKSVSFKNLFGL